MKKTLALAAFATVTVLTLGACSSDDDSTSTDATEQPSGEDQAAGGDGEGQIGTPIVKGDASLTVNNLTVGEACKYGELPEAVIDGGKVLQTEATFTNDGDQDRTIMNPVPLNDDGTKAVVPESIEYNTPCRMSDSEDGTINWYDGGEAGATRDIYNVQVIPAEATKVDISGTVFSLPETAQ